VSDLQDAPFGVEPGLVGRCGWDVEETQRDIELLAWIGRFRFVTAQAVSERFGVSWQRANARARRLERLRLVGREHEHVSQARAIFLTGRGHELLGWPRRRAPRAQVQREHEAAIVWLVTQLERDAGGSVRILTERECRQLEAADPLRRFSVAIVGGEHRGRRRWPDVVIESDARRGAIEIEFAPKGSARLRHILEAYAVSGYAEVNFLVKDAALGQRITGLARQRPDALRSQLGRPRCSIKVSPWPGLPSEAQERLAVALAPRESGQRGTRSQ
jgi:hypothetical protein